MVEALNELGISGGLVYVVLALAVVQTVLQMWALSDLARRERVRFGKRWIWFLLIFVLSVLGFGAILYLVWGRKVPNETAEPKPSRMKAGN
jgi:hypothetical protein